jgi:surface antigen
MRKLLLIAFVLLNFFAFTSFNPTIGEVIDEFNGVKIYFNGDKYTNVAGRNVTEDGYNLGLKFQCVEFVKRYYYDVFDHKMPNSYGHAKDFFDKSLGDEGYNTQRGLMQYKNVRTFKPEVNDILVYDAFPGNPFGHVAIVSKVTDEYVEMVQQNIGKTTRKKVNLIHFMDYWTVADYHILGWLRRA